MPEAYFENEKTHKKYTVVKFDKEQGKVRIRGEAGFEFDERYNPALFRQMGYTLKIG
jgi:hypothetical protein